MTQLEFWPDYNGLLWDAHGKPIPLDSLNLADDLVARAKSWSSSYDDGKLPIDSQGENPSAGNSRDPQWLVQGAELFKVL